ncbi:MAG TPA: hypothetical protein VJN43_06300 [Bryobacteraceae bacterium]|nr:hypothetical protein [Bryobacteraceae bacterium]
MTGDQPTLELSAKRSDPLTFISTDKIAGVLGELPELNRAVRNGDVPGVSGLCAKLFESVAAKHATKMVSQPNEESTRTSLGIF